MVLVVSAYKAFLKLRCVSVALKRASTDAKMDGAVTGEAAAHDAQGRFVSGHTEYAARKRRLAERLAKLRLDYDPSPSQQMLLVVISGTSG